jgi:hypothetical protein
VDIQVDAVRRQGLLALRRRELAHGIEDDVVGHAALGEVLLRVVDDTVCPEGSHQLKVGGAADAGDVGPE